MNKLIKAALNWCNERRKEKGLEPLERLPKGKIMDGHSCPCGKATGLYVGSYSYYPGGMTFQERVIAYPLGFVPEAVLEFIKEFDHGKFPELEE